MKLIYASLIIFAFLINSNAIAADTAKSSGQLTEWEKKKIADEFNHYFKTTDNGAFQKLNKNPWASKRARQSQQAQRVLRVSATLSSCKKYSIQQRRQCYVAGNSKSACELFYKARLDHCSKYF